MSQEHPCASWAPRWGRERARPLAEHLSSARYDGHHYHNHHQHHHQHLLGQALCWGPNMGDLISLSGVITQFYTWDTGTWSGFIIGSGAHSQWMPGPGATWCTQIKALSGSRAIEQREEDSRGEVDGEGEPAPLLGPLSWGEEGGKAAFSQGTTRG